MKSNNKVHAILWDYDGTLVDSRVKNFYVTQKIIHFATGKESGFFPAFQSLESFYAVYQQSANWRDLYQRAFGLTEEQTDEAGMLWSEYQLKDNTPIPFYRGISEVLKELGKLPHGIVSQNSQAAIVRSLQENGLSGYFRSVIGYEEVALNRQKPAPDGLLKAIEEVTDPVSGYVFYIGDHETDTKCAFNANAILKERGIDLKVISIAALYGSDSDDSSWAIKPDYRAHSPGDIVRIFREY